MLVFLALIVARWLGWSAPNLCKVEVLKLWNIVETGLGWICDRTFGAEGVTGDRRLNQEDLTP